MPFSVATLLINFMENSKISTKTCFSMLKHSFQCNLLEKIWCLNFGVTVYHFSTWPKNSTSYLHILFWHFLCCFSSKNLCFHHFHFFFWWSVKFPQKNINQSETRIGEEIFSGILCSEEITPFLNSYQTEKPIVPFMIDDLNKLIVTILSRFIKPGVTKVILTVKSFHAAIFT